MIGTKKIEILIIDDDATICKLLSAVLEKLGHQVFSSQESEPGLELAKSHNIDLIFLDINMPGKSGIEILKELKQDPQTAFIPVLMLTAMGSIDIIKDAIKNGASEYLVKPIDRNLIRERLKIYTADVHHNIIRQLLAKASINDKSAFKGNYLPASLARYDCYPLNIDGIVCSLLIWPETTPKKLINQDNDALEDSCCLYLKSALKWVPIWPDASGTFTTANENKGSSEVDDEDDDEDDDDLEES